MAEKKDENIEKKGSTPKKINETTKSTASKNKSKSIKTKSAVSKTTKSKTLPTENINKEQSQKLSSQPKTENKADRGPQAFGIGLIVFGLIMLAGRFLGIPFSEYLWPFIFILPGALLFILAISSERENGEGLAIAGGILGTLGLVFLMQTVTGFWASWAYIWALIAPTSIGLSQVFYGNIKGRDSIVSSGTKLTKVGLTILAVGFIFFELILGISGFGLYNLGLPVFPMILIFIGGFILLRSLIRSK